MEDAAQHDPRPDRADEVLNRILPSTGKHDAPDIPLVLEGNTALGKVGPGDMGPIKAKMIFNKRPEVPVPAVGLGQLSLVRAANSF
jgi:hypothetical protein